MDYKYNLIQKITPLIPARLRALIRQYVSLKEYDYERRKAENEFQDMKAETYPGSPLKMGIIEDISYYHRHYIAACREMKISYQVLDLTDSDWVNNFVKSNCDIFLVWPSITNTAIKYMFDSRLRILEEEMGRRLYPTLKECWLYENKPRLRDWLLAHNVPHPRSWVFYDKRQALEFSTRVKLPIVLKSATGASASGIYIAKTVQELKRIIRTCFDRGLTPRGFHPRDRQWGFVYLQEYIPDVHEWRMVRIGDSFFGYRKEKGPDGLHSSSHQWSWIDPGENLLNLLKDITDKGPFTSMDVDIFQTPDDRFLVNELQTVFGCTTPDVQMKVNNVAGRYIWNNDEWEFQPGDFCANHMCNLRIEYICQRYNNCTT